jgi:hypothetical protein
VLWTIIQVILVLKSHLLRFLKVKQVLFDVIQLQLPQCQLLGLGVRLTLIDLILQSHSQRVVLQYLLVLLIYISMVQREYRLNLVRVISVLLVA